jgi:hypothetical protein
MTDKINLQTCNRYLGESPYKHDITLLSMNKLSESVNTIVNTHYKNIIFKIQDFDGQIASPINELIKSLDKVYLGIKPLEKHLLFTQFFNHTFRLLREGWRLGKEIGFTIDENDIPWDKVRKLKGLAQMGYALAKGLKTMEEKHSFENNRTMNDNVSNTKYLQMLCSPGFETIREVLNFN